MERIPRATILAALASSAALALGPGWGSPAVAHASPDAPSEPAGDTAPPAALRCQPLRAGGAPGIRLAVGALGRSGRRPVRVRVAAPPIRRVRTVDLQVDGRTAARVRPRGGVCAGAAGWIDVARFPAGRRRLRVVIRRASGSISRERIVRLRRPIPIGRPLGRREGDLLRPSVSITAPAPGAIVSGSVPIRATVEEPGKIALVELAIDGESLDVDATPPFGDSWTWETADVGNGIHQISVRAVDTAGNMVSASHEVTVWNAFPRALAPSPLSGSRILWGAWIDGDRWGYGDAPWDARTIDRFEAQANQHVSILHWGQPWYWGNVPQPFHASNLEAVRRRGAIPLVSWASWELDRGGSNDQPAFQLQDIIAGSHDPYIRSWARGAKAWGEPFFLRFNHEMNGTWYPWSEARNGNRPGEYVRAWRHVHDIFASVGADNVTWVWSPNTVYPGSIPLAGLYPGDAYVDWVAIDGYNWGTNPIKPSGWRSFSQIFRPTYDSLGALAPSKPVMIAEVGSSESGGSKAAWIADALSVQLPTAFPRIKALVWFDWNADGMDWVVESSDSARSAFAAGIASPSYVGNEYATLAGPTIAVPDAIP